MNASLKIAVALLISLEISFTKSISLNIALIVCAIIYLLFKQVNWKLMLYSIFLPILPAFGSWSSLYFYGTGDHVHMAFVLFTRIFAYIWIGSCFTFTTNIDELLKSLEQNFRLPNTFVYGVLAAFNFLPRIAQEVKTIRLAARMRGEVLHFYSPQIFFKAILTSFNWSNNLAQAMRSHGFAEGERRTHYHVIKIPTWNWLAAAAILIAVQAFLFMSPFN
ncbi:energy-coupling factor transporter transmembrane component T family protein [Periweissella ghanensis]|uniref:Energy-coupling factor transporter transmembrane protein EcfT n=1 Tax=Periweissella ghanensis TaxID=467997 RepID=A0ABM8ZD18_9LACO|nr:energy-coupling factor transporter transmembrane component T [Periweissella ghanensis]MCM0600130.1 energy-coupling factor transporter transmembrane protein EcfT [Periweissella ghanensis]CAH0419464.1 Energy-coupling factor transporter transmembrane protein EcfT [Periweissella ghanensis]